jgi:hypothetical protein
MQILKMPEAKKMVKSYLDGYITVKELREELEWYWNKEICKGTERPVVERTGVPMNAFSENDV